MAAMIVWFQGCVVLNRLGRFDTPNSAPIALISIWLHRFADALPIIRTFGEILVSASTRNDETLMNGGRVL